MESDRVVYGREDYQLVAFSEHIGGDARSGHYLGYSTETSQMFDDMVGEDENGYAIAPGVEDIDSEDLDSAKKRGFIFLYKKVTNR